MNRFVSKFLHNLKDVSIFFLGFLCVLFVGAVAGGVVAGILYAIGLSSYIWITVWIVVGVIFVIATAETLENS